MGYPQPKYWAELDVGYIMQVEDNTFIKDKSCSVMLSSSISALAQYIKSTFYLAFDAEYRQFDDFVAKRGGFRPDGTLISYFIVSSNRVPKQMRVSLHSFNTPLDSVKKELMEIVQQECRKYKK